MKTIYCIVLDDYLIGATDISEDAARRMIDPEHDDFATAIVSASVDDLAARAFMDQGTSDQVFADGYAAFKALTKENKAVA